jgi:hypothetical protein
VIQIIALLDIDSNGKVCGRFGTGDGCYSVDICIEERGERDATNCASCANHGDLAALVQLLRRHAGRFVMNKESYLVYRWKFSCLRVKLSCLMVTSQSS